jgi:hypothetical protein
MAKASDWVILTILMLLGVILAPIIVTEVQNAEQQVSTIEKTVTLYPSSDSALQLTVGSGTASKVTTNSGEHWISTHALTLSALNENVQTLKDKTLTLTVYAQINVSSVVASIIGNWTIIKSDWNETQYLGKSESANLTATTDWQTITFTFNFPKYTIVDATDKLKFEYWVNVYTPQPDSKITIDFSKCEIENFGYDYVNASEGWSFTGGTGARTLLLLIPFIFIVGIVVYFIGQLLGKW